MANEVDETAAKNPLVLAFIGDAYWTLYIRGILVAESHEKAGKLHIKANKYVSAPAQARFFDKVAPLLSEQERAIATRARNAENYTRPKNCSLLEYKLATAFEAVIGYNYLCANQKRLESLISAIITPPISGEK